MDLNLPVAVAVSFGVGLFEWWLAICRTLAVIKCKKFTVAWTTFTEVFTASAVSLYAITQFSLVEAILIFGFYAAGGSLGAVLPLIKQKWNT
jgi:hypothetical protein